MEVGLGSGDFVFDGDPATPRIEGTPTTAQFLAHVYCGQTAGWMKTPLGAEVDLGPGHTVLDGSQLCAKRAQQPHIFSAGVYCGHGRPSQLLLSSCEHCYHLRAILWQPNSAEATERALLETRVDRHVQYVVLLPLLWPPYVIGGHYIFAL